MARRGTMRAIGRLILIAARHAAAARLILGVLLLLSIAAIVSGRFSTDISRIDTDLISSILNCCDCHLIIKMNVCNKRNMNCLLYTSDAADE